MCGTRVTGLACGPSRVCVSSALWGRCRRVARAGAAGAPQRSRPGRQGGWGECAASMAGSDPADGHGDDAHNDGHVAHHGPYPHYVLTFLFLSLALGAL